jgi:phage tail-like protein
MGHRNDQKNRRPDIFHESRVKEVLSSHIRESYPQLVNFLDCYYDFMDSDGGNHAFDNKIHEILSLRDTEEVPEEFLAQLTYELASRLENNEKFTNARFALQRLAYLYREKGTPKGIEEFFKTFFQTEVEVIYPKKDIFIVGEDEIGPDYEHYIQDYRLYQNYSLLLKLGLSRNQYETLYKKFMHPAGWYFEGETSFTSEATMPIGVSFPLEDSAIISYVNEVYEPIFQQSRYTEIVSQNTNNEFYFSEIGGTIKTSDWKRDGNVDYEDSHLDMLYNTIEEYQNYTIAELSRFYQVGDFAGNNSHTFDEEQLYEVDWSEIETALLQAAAFNSSGYLHSFLVSDRGDGYLYGDINLSNQGGTQVFGPGAPITAADASEAQDYGNNGTTGTQAYDDHIEQYLVPELRRLRRSDPSTYNAAFTSTPTDDPVMDFSNIIETMDNGMYTRYSPWFHHRDSSA